MTKRTDPRPDWARRLIAMGPNVGGAQHLIPLDPDELIATAPRPRRPFQGWRYFEAKDAPPDLAAGDAAALPPALARELMEIGAW